MNEPIMKKPMTEQEWMSGAGTPGRPEQPLYPHGAGNNPMPNAQQYQAMAKQYADALIAIKKDVELRKWAIDQACGLVGAQVEAESAVLMHPVTLAREIHDFILEGAIEKII